MKRALESDPLGNNPVEEGNESKKIRIRFPLVFLIGKDEFMIEGRMYERLQDEEPNCLFLLLCNTLIPLDRTEKGQIIIEFELGYVSKMILEEYLSGKTGMKQTKICLTGTTDWQKLVLACEYLGLSELISIMKKARNNQFASNWTFSNNSSIVTGEISRPFKIYDLVHWFY